jgi:hypothetical protein
MPGPDPALEILNAVNAPLFLPRRIYAWILDGGIGFDLVYIRDVAAYTVAVGLLWGFVALKAGRRHKPRSILTFERTPLRAVADIVAIGIGISTLAVVPTGCGGYPWPEFDSCYGSSIWTWCVPAMVAQCLCLAWCLTLVVVFGRDLTRLIARRRNSSGSA